MEKTRISKTARILVIGSLLLGMAIGSLSVGEVKAFVFGSIGQSIGNFLGLTDTPSSYSGEAGKIVQVKSDETGLEFGAGVVDATTATMSIYCSAGTGNDTTGDGSSGNPYATIAKSISVIPTYVRHAVTIWVDDDNDNNGSHANYAKDSLSVSKTILGGSITIKSNNYQEYTRATGGGASTITKTGIGWTVNQWKGGRVYLLKGTGKAQYRTIASNTADTITTTDAWTVNPDSTTYFTVITTEIRGDDNKDGIQDQDRAGLILNTQGYVFVYGFRFAYFTHNAFYIYGRAQVGLINNAFDHIDTGEDELGVIRCNQFSEADVYYSFIHDCYYSAQSKNDDAAAINLQFNSFSYVLSSVINNVYYGIKANAGAVLEIIGSCYTDSASKCERYGLWANGVSAIKHPGAGYYPQGIVGDILTQNGGVVY